MIALIVALLTADVAVELDTVSASTYACPGDVAVVSNPCTDNVYFTDAETTTVPVDAPVTTEPEVVPRLISSVAPVAAVPPVNEHIPSTSTPDTT